MVTTQALVGRFESDAHRFEARPVRVNGQPTWTLHQLGLLYRLRFDGDAAALHTTLIAHDWSVLDATLRTAVHQFVTVPGVGRGYPAAECGDPVRGDRVTDEPWGAGEWLYLWEHHFGALHAFVSGAGRWHHVATLPPRLLAFAPQTVMADIEIREWWLKEAW